MPSEHFRPENQALPKRLTVVIPAFNEEEAIGDTIEKCLGARTSLKERTSIEDIEIIVVSDGSVDRTVNIARSYKDISVIVCENNHGYGAAIKRGFEMGTGDLLGFMDADGTCDPEFFAELCNHACETCADVVLGSRMHKTSKMPIARRVGNRLYATLLSYISNSKVTDTASGMRVIRREALSTLYPLPDGLHFTPAMTCRALLHDKLSIREIPMPYHDRLGDSKLKVHKDGVRFLLAITDIALSYRPLKFIGWAAALLFLIAFCYGIGPTAGYLKHRIIQDSSIYRLLAINTMILAGLTLLSIGIVAERVSASLNGGKRKYTLMERFLLALCSTKNMLVAGPVLIFFGVGLNIGTILEYITFLHISHHWVYVSTGALLVLAGMQIWAVGVFERLIERIINKENKKQPAGHNRPSHYH